MVHRGDYSAVCNIPTDHYTRVGQLSTSDGIQRAKVRYYADCSILDPLCSKRKIFLINGEVLDYYGIFVLGVAVSKYDVLGKYGFLSDKRMRLLKYIVVAAVSFAVTLLIFSRLSLTYGFSLVMQNALFLLFVLLAFCLARIIVVSSSKASPPLSRALWYRVLLFLISFSWSAIYLFFLIILVPLMYALLGTQLTGFEIDIIQIFVGLPIVVLVAYLLQRAQNEIVSKIRKYRTSSEPRPDRT